MGMIQKLKEDAEKIRGYSLRQKIEYIREYYMISIVVLLILVALLVSFIVTIVSKKETALSGVLLNTSLSSDGAVTQLEEAILNHLELDGEKYQVELSDSLSYDPLDGQMLQTNYATLETLAAQSIAGAIDFVAGNQEALVKLAYSDLFMDLSQVLTQEQLERYADKLLYVDGAVLEVWKTGADVTIPDPSKPELMQRPVPVFLSIGENETIGEVYSYSKECILLAVSANYPHGEALVAFLELLFGE